MHKKDMITYLESKIVELNSLVIYIKDVDALNVINGKIATLEDILEFTKKASVPYDLI